MRTLFRIHLADFQIKEPEDMLNTYRLKIDFGGPLHTCCVSFKRRQTLSLVEKHFEYWTTDLPIYKKSVTFQLFTQNLQRRKIGQVVLSLYDVATGPARLHLTFQRIQICCMAQVIQICPKLQIRLFNLEVNDLKSVPQKKVSPVNMRISFVGPPKRMDLKNRRSEAIFIADISAEEFKKGYILFQISKEGVIIGRTQLSLLYYYGLSKQQTPVPFLVRLTELEKDQKDGWNTRHVKRLPFELKGFIEILRGPTYLQMKGGRLGNNIYLPGEPYLGFALPILTSPLPVPFAPMPPLSLRDLFPQSLSQTFLPVPTIDLDLRLKDVSLVYTYWVQQQQFLLRERNMELSRGAESKAREIHDQYIKKAEALTTKCQTHLQFLHLLFPETPLVQLPS